MSLLDGVIKHIHEAWINHLSAGSATVSSLVYGADILKSLECGLIVFFVTYTLRIGLDKVFRKK